MTFVIRSFALLAVIAPCGLGAQTAGPDSIPKTAAGCLTAFHSYKSKQLASARARNRALTTAQASAINTDAAAFAHRCADAVTARGVRAADVSTLAAVYDSAHDHVRASAHLLLRDLGVSITPAGYTAYFIVDRKPTPAQFARAESLATRLDALPDSANDLKLLGQRKLLVESRDLDAHASIAYHARRVLDLVHAVGTSTSLAGDFIVEASADLAEELAENDAIDSAFAVIDRARSEVDSARFASSALPAARARYGLVGRPAPPIDAPHWFNAPENEGPRELARGKVTLIQFTGVACAPCRESYSSMTAIYNRFDRSSFDMLFATGLSGDFAGKKMTSAEELAANREYYVGRYGFSFPIAVQEARPATDPNWERYHVGGIPQFVLVDRKGVVRYIALGWDASSAARFEKRVAGLIAER
jgi:hypothetical protein